MMFRFKPRVHPPYLATCLYQDAIWRMDPVDFSVYLTFDDGPIPEVTPWVLALLDREQVPATFFCVGENVARYPWLMDEILKGGHSVGNHTYNHLQGIKTPDEEFYANIDKAAAVIESGLFRPPHGLLTYRQYKMLMSAYRIVMWDIVSRDYDRKTNPAMVVRNIRHFVRPGSIITFHDSLKAQYNLERALPAVIKMLKEKGYQFKAIPMQKGNPLILPPQEKMESLHT